jgi:hypothetical protein
MKNHCRAIVGSVAALLCLAALLPPAEAATSVTLQPSVGDSYVYSGATGTNYGTVTPIYVATGSSTQTARIPVIFNLSTIPTDALVKSATLSLYMTTAPTLSRTYNAHRITSSWAETGGTGVTWANQGTFNATATSSLTTGTGAPVWRDWTITADVQGWVNGAYTNYGTLIKDNTETGSQYFAAFCARETSTSPCTVAANRPKLVVTYLLKIRDLTATAGNAQVILNWVHPATNTTDYNGTLIIRRAGTAPTSIPTDGTVYTAGSSTLADGSLVVFNDSTSCATTCTTTFTNNTGLTNGTTYYYQAFTRDSSNKYSPVSATVTSTPTSAVAPSPTWGYSTSAASLAAPGINPNDVVITGSNDYKIHGINAADGTRAFIPFATGGAIQARPAVIPAGYSATGVDVAYIPSQDGYVYAIDTNTGAQVWKSPSLAGANQLQGGVAVRLKFVKALTICGVTTTDAVFVGTFVTSSDTNKVYALNGRNTSVTTTANFGGNCPASITTVPAGGILWSFTGVAGANALRVIYSTPYVDYTTDTLWVTSHATGTTTPSVWKFDISNGSRIVPTPSTLWNLDDISASPTPSSDGAFMYVGSLLGTLSAIRINDGAVFNCTPPACGGSTGTGEIKGLPWPLGGSPEEIVFTRDTTIHKVFFDTAAATPTFNPVGSTPWTSQLTGTPNVSAPVDDFAGNIYVGTSLGKLHRIQVSDGAAVGQVTVSTTGYDKGFNFRNTPTYAIDGTNETYVVGDGYSTTRNGATFGWETVSQIRDRVATNDRRLAGSNQTPNTGTQIAFRVDLPAVGTYQIHLALGDAGSAQGDEYLQIKDDTTVLMTLDKPAGTAIQQFYDATGALLTNATWPTSEAGTTLTFASTILRVVIGTPAVGANSSSLAHLRIVRLGGTVGDPAFDGVLNRIYVGATDGHVYMFSPGF